MYKHFTILALAAFMLSCTQQPVTLTILHTNDTHSQVEPIDKGVKNGDCGGYARRMGLIAQEREKDPELLLFDAGDFCQGTPYFNIYKGDIEIDAINRMKYDAVTLGNHEFDNGVDTLAAKLKKLQCPVVCANYVVENTPLQDIVKPYTILYRKGLKIGVFGLGVNPQGLITDVNFSPLQYLDPIETGNKTATMLKNQEKCDVVICLSHIGTIQKDGIPCDSTLIKSAKDIDLVIGGHTHMLFENHFVTDQDNDSILSVQMQKSGVYVGKVQLTIEEIE